MNVSRQDDVLIVTMTTKEASGILRDLDVASEYAGLELSSQVFVEEMIRKGVE